jgi:hypothetical protein
VIRAGVRIDWMIEVTMTHSALGISQVQETVHYVEQLEQSSEMSLQEEYLAFLKKHGAHFDEKYLWD